MKILSKGQSAPTIITVQLAWHNNNPMIQNMHLNHVRKSKDQEPVCKKTQGFVGFNPLGSEEANISKTETE